MVPPRLLLEHSPRKKPAAIEGKFEFFPSIIGFCSLIWLSVPMDFVYKYNLYYKTDQTIRPGTWMAQSYLHNKT